MKLRTLSVFLAPLVLLTSSACDSPRSPITGPGDRVHASARNVQPLPDQADPDTEFARLARTDLPGFAGLYLDDAGTPVILLTDQSQRGAAERHFARRLAELRKGRLSDAPQRPRFRSAVHDFAQLKDWFDRLGGLVEHGGVFMLDIDEVENRIFVGVRDDAATGLVRAEAARLGVPPAALRVEMQSAPAVRSGYTVRERVPELAGGYQITSSARLCTLGFNAVYEGRPVFVTNSHCTPWRYKSDGGAIWQAESFDAADIIGSEIRDRGMYRCLLVSGFYCRKADAAYIQNNLSRPAIQGAIAYTFPANRGTPGGLTVAGYHNITGRRTDVFVGMYLDKTGRTSGTTFGQVTRSCVMIDDLACQDVSDVYSEGGDSGSPMYYWTEWGAVQLYGILWGGPVGDWNTTYSSRISGIESDLGSLSAICHPLYNC